MRNVADLRKGERAVIHSFADLPLSLKLLEMGCLPGTQLTLQFVAPLGDPLGILVEGQSLSLRRAEAATILID
jgi:ferrous iron transport protein A